MQGCIGAQVSFAGTEVLINYLTLLSPDEPHAGQCFQLVCTFEVEQTWLLVGHLGSVAKYKPSVVNFLTFLGMQQH